MTSMNEANSNRTSSRFAGRFLFASIGLLLVFAGLFSSSGCGYKFKDISILPNVKTVKINFIENRATYINPQLSPRLTDKLRQKVVSQTRLSQTNNDNADWIVDGIITGYSFSTAGISNQQVATNRLTISVDISLNDQKNDTIKKYSVSRNFDFPASLSIQAAEASKADEIINGLTDDMFNRLFSDW